MILIERDVTGDNRTCDPAQVDQQMLLKSSVRHIQDVRNALAFFACRLDDASKVHDHDKISEIEWFHHDFVAYPNFRQSSWLAHHFKVNRHHLLETTGIPADVNLIDVLEMIADCVMAGLARTGALYELKLPPELLATAFRNTVELLKANVEVKS